jgi:hypothetical protein
MTHWYGARIQRQHIFMKTFACLLSLAATLSAADSINIDVHGTQIVVPCPPGFVPVTSQMKQVDALQRQFVAPMNELFAGFIPEADAPAALEGRNISLPRTFTVQSEKRAAAMNVTKKHFEGLKTAIKSQNEKILNDVERQLPGMIEKMNRGVAKEFGINPGISVPQMIPFPPHEDTDRSIAYSMLVRVNANGPDAKPESAASIVTGTFVLVNGKILFLYSNAGEDDLEWSRAISKDWSGAVLAANPAEGKTAARNPLTGNSFGARVLRGTLIGALIGLVIGLFRQFSGSRKPKTGEDS